MKELYKENKKYVDKFIFLLVFFIFAYIFLKYVLSYIGPFVVGFLISVIISPLVGFIQRKLKIARSISTIFLIIIIILLLAILGTSIFNRVIIESRYLSETLPASLEEFRNFLYEMEDRFERYMTFIPEEFALDFNEMVNQLLVTLTTFLTDFAMAFSVGFVTRIPLILLNVFLCLISAFFFTKDKKLIGESLMKTMPEWLKTRLRTIQQGFLSAIGGYVRAQLTIMSVVASISILGLTIQRYPYAVIMGLVVALFDSMPMIGTGLVFWPWAIINLISGNYSFAIGLIIINAVCFLTRQFLEPKVLGQQIGLHPLMVLVGIYVGLQVFGIIGIFLGPALLVIAKLILETTDGAPVTPPVPKGRIYGRKR
ncbi:MAG: sporulation integral membrane protein YtvI [Defluviitaleaceae bacterium]|nr:sporulation integral membrane protein YtvI [Defluviitaleaceae bacterium]MCL2837310.1 sporulation integral membrane protein YtvI [Defluviitaleaceae bacterium]